MSQPDYYAVLGVPRSATVTQIKEAYRRLVRRYHPDVNRDAYDDARMKQINEAYKILSNMSRRTAYDIQMLEEMRSALIREMLLHQREELQKADRITWKEGMAGFVHELRKGLQGE